MTVVARVAVRQMGVAQRHLHIGMTKQARDHRHQHAVHDGMAGHRVERGPGGRYRFLGAVTNETAVATASANA